MFSSQTEITEGYARSNPEEVLIGSGETDSAEIDFGRNYAFFVIECDDMAGIDAATTLSFKASVSKDRALSDVQANLMAEKFATGTLPETGTFYGVLLESFGARRLQFILDTATTADVTFTVWGFDSSKEGFR